jgi:hypothetical protein
LNIELPPTVQRLEALTRQLLAGTGWSLDDFIQAGPALRRALARDCVRRGDVLGWCHALFPEKFRLPACPLHPYLVSIRHDEFTATKAPRYHAKTTISCFAIPIYQALNEPHAYRHYLNVQGTETKAIEINRSIKLEIEQNEFLTQLYGPLVGEYWADSRFVLKNGVVFSAISTGQSIRGINYRNQRPDYLLVDDLYDETDINNPESTEKKNAWFWSTLYLCRARNRRANIHLTGTAINAYDLLTQCEGKPGIKTRTFRAFDFEKKTVLWPDLGSYEQQKTEFDAMPPTIAMRELQNEPRDDASAIIKDHWLYPAGARSWEFDPADLDHSLRQGERRLRGVYMGNDPSIGKNDESDPTGTSLLWETVPRGSVLGSEFWIMGLWAERLSLDERCRQLMQIANQQDRERRVTRVFIEAIAGFDDYAAYVIRQTNLPVKRVEWVKDKITNLENHSHFFQNGKIHLSARIDPAMKSMIRKQLTTNVPKNDDLRDAVFLPMEPFQPTAWSWVAK